MASGIDPDAKPVKRSAPARPAGGPAKPAGTAQPPAARPAPPAAQPGAKPAAARPAASPPEPPPDEPRDNSIRGLLKTTPAWAISMLVHIIALLAMALFVTPTPPKEKPRLITSDEVFEEPLEPEAVQPTVLPPVPKVENFKVDAPNVDVPNVDVPNVDVPNVDVPNVDAPNFDAPTIPGSFGDEIAPPELLGHGGGTGPGGPGPGGPRWRDVKNVSNAPPETVDAVDRALKWLIAHQMPDGGWHFNLKQCPNCAGQCSTGSHREDRCGATALAILPFLGRGYTHKEGPYKSQLEAGIAFLVGMARKNKDPGQFYAEGGSMYSQGLAGIALSESYAMTQDPRLAMPTQLALNFIMQSQDPIGGGWRYAPRQPGDTSAVGWQFMALKSGHMAHLQIDPLVIKKASEFLDSVQHDDGSAYGYTDPGNRPGTNAVGLLCRMYLGWNKDHPALQRGVERLAKVGPSTDLYFDYYATQIMHHIKGDVWTAWDDRMKKMLLTTQATAGHAEGSWLEGVDGGHPMGRVYCTAMATMILEVYYRHLPIYGSHSVDDEFEE